MLVKTLLPFVLAALAVNAHPVFPSEKTPADAKDAVLAAIGGHGHGSPLEGAHPPTGQRRDVPEPPVKPEGVKGPQELPVGQAPVPHDRMPKKPQLPASPPSTPVDGKAPQVASRDFVTKPAALDEVDPMSERNSALGVEHGAAQNAPVGTRDVKPPVSAPVAAPATPAPASAPAAPAPVPAAKAPAAAPAPVKNVANDEQADSASDSDSDPDSDSDSDSDEPVGDARRRALPVAKPATPVKLPVEENKFPVRDSAPEVPSFVADKSQMVPSAVPHAVPRQVKAPEVKSRPFPGPQDVPSVSPKAEKPTVTAPQEEKPTVTASDVQPTTVTGKVSDVPSAPTNAAEMQ